MKTQRYVLVVASLLALAGQAPLLASDGLHPAVPLLDAQGDEVIDSGQPLSTMVSCGGDCHDTGYIMATSDHADAGFSVLGKEGAKHDWQAGPGYFGGWNPLSYSMEGLGEEGRVDVEAWLGENGGRHIGGGPAAGLVEMDCLLCHIPALDLAPRTRALETGDFAWANSAPLAALGILVQTEHGWKWNVASFDEHGALREGLLEVRRPADENCGQCHGVVDNRLDPPLTVPSDVAARHNTERTGQLMSPQKLSNSGLNLAGKESLDYPFDVHVDRVVGCVDCHYSLNNPVFFRQRPESKPAHLNFDPRRMGFAEYLERPMHQFAKGSSTLGLAADTTDTLRRCESCHQAGEAHGWLPYRQRHFAALACESCHVPRLFGPALQSVDWTLLDTSGGPLRHYRNLDGDPSDVGTLVEGYQPVLLPRANPEGGFRLAPWNLVTGWYWVAGEPARPVSQADLQRALLVSGGHHPALLEALDENGDGALQAGELKLADEQSVATVRALLEDSGLGRPHIVGEAIPFAVSHNVVNGRWAVRECKHCHGADSLLGAGFELSGHQPPGGELALSDDPGLVMTGAVAATDSGGLEFVPEVREAGFYVLGLHSYEWADQLGLLMFLGIVLGVSGHGLGRFLAARRRPANHVPTERVYMYDAYERLWHWLQAIAILLLLFTGLIIHKPHFFGMFSFAYVVQVHNVLGFILLINAALALFYNLASGEIRQYLPKPRGFVGRSLAQTMYYTRGIFAGLPHPLEKTREEKLNPLQQITYLGILNVLLPAQVVTGVLIWGLQRWPAIAEQLGGFQALALVHTLVAWAFAAFIVMHVYLTTAAGHTPAAGIKAMIEGWDHVETSGPAKGGKL